MKVYLGEIGSRYRKPIKPIYFDQDYLQLIDSAFVKKGFGKLIDGPIPKNKECLAINLILIEEETKGETTSIIFCLFHQSKDGTKVDLYRHCGELSSDIESRVSINQFSKLIPKMLNSLIEFRNSIK